jgi:glycyl-tRNA synthetase
MLSNLPDKLQKESVVEKVQELAKRRGFFWQSAEVYSPVGGFWNYGPLGLVLKNKIISSWRKWFVKDENAYEIETSNILPEIVWVASGHVENFVDKIVECKKCKSKFRADHLIEDALGEKEKLEGKTTEELTKIIKENKIKCPKCGGELSEVRTFNLMFPIYVGAYEETKCYLRPETTQASVLDFMQVYRTQRGKLPLKVAQVGKAFRNEISPRQIFMRMREFTMAELQVFFNPEETKYEDFKSLSNYEVNLLPAELRLKGEEKFVSISVSEALEKGWIPNELIAYYIAKVFAFFVEELEFRRDYVRYKELLPEERAHYAKVHWDLEVYSEDFGWQECVNNAWRSDYDLSRHQKFSKQNFSVFENGKRILPHLYEPSFGIDRIFLLMLVNSFREDKERTWLQIKRKFAPYEVGVFPLVSKDELKNKAREVYMLLKNDFNAFYDESDSIGRRYRRADEIGIPACVTVDFQTLEDNSVTVRDRDTMQQIRTKTSDLTNVLKKFLNGAGLETLA